MIRSMKYHRLIMLVLLSLASLVARAESSTASRYVTWEGSEPDRGASAWFIKRFVDPEAEFVSVPQEAELPEGQPFDVPESRFRRSARFSTFEVLLNEYPVADPAVKQLARTIHDIEINTWTRKVAPATPAVLYALERIVQAHGKAPVPLDCQISFFEGVYRQLSSPPLPDPLVFDIPDKCRTGQK